MYTVYMINTYILLGCLIIDMSRGESYSNQCVCGLPLDPETTVFHYQDELSMDRIRCENSELQRFLM